MLLPFFSSINTFSINTVEVAVEIPAEAAEPKIYVGDVIYFVDDETGRCDWGIFEGFYCDLRSHGESSPYWAEHTQGIHRLQIREDDGRANYILPQNVYALSEVEGHVFEVSYAF
jgi:hypothetical protein